MVAYLLNTGTPSTLLFLSLVGFTGILLGKVKIFKFKLGIAGVMFAGLIAGHFGAHSNPDVLHFVKEFGLILFVYSIGIDIGPRFISSFRSTGLTLNGVALLICLVGFGTTLLIKSVFHLDAATAAGIFCGAVTNTPGLGAAQTLLAEQANNGTALSQISGMGYAVAYPFGIIGIILVMVLIRFFFRIDVKGEHARFNDDIDSRSAKLETVNLTVTNPNLVGKTVQFFKEQLDKEFALSRISRGGKFLIPSRKLVLEKNDVLYGLASNRNFQALELSVGKLAPTEKVELSGELRMRHVIVTNRKLIGKKLSSLNFSDLFPANITRIYRGQSQLPVSGDSTLAFGDTVRVVGARERMGEVADFLGNSIRELSRPNLIPLFVGIFLGVILGAVPVFIPGLPAPARLGLAGGPLIIAILLGHKGRIGPLDFYMTPGANLFVREMGIILFLACVGLGSGQHFVATLLAGGYMWMLYGAAITFVPLLVAGVTARLLKLNYLTICGLLAGAMTDPPALEFANSISSSQAQASAYATVYPLTMFLRILSAQVLVLLAG